MPLKSTAYAPYLSAILDEAFCVMLFDSSGKIIHANNKFCTTAGYKPNELIGKSLDVLHDIFSPAALHRAAKQQMAHGEMRNITVPVYSRNGDRMWMDATVMPMYHDEEKTVRYLAFGTDVTESRHIMQKYKRTRTDLENFKHALDEAAVVAITNAQGVITYVNDRFLELSKYSRDELVGKTHRVVNSGTHPKSFFKEMWSTIQSGKVWRGDIRNRSKEGNMYWVNTTIFPVLGNNGKPQEYISVRQNVTSHKEAENSLAIALQNDFKQTVKNLQNVIFKYTFTQDEGITFTMLEGKTADELGLTKEMLNELSFHEKFNLSLFKRRLLEGMLGNSPQFEMEFGRYTFLVYLSPITNENNAVAEVVGTAIDITERKEAERLVEHMAYHDHLTGLPNRRRLKQTVQELIESRKASNQPFALLYADLDRFKHINDSMGHYIGDQLLILVGERLKSLVRKHDMVGRLSGDEFLILCTSATKEEVCAVANRIVKEISNLFTIGNLEIFIAPSIGISMFPEDGSDYDTLIRNADSAMYLAKQSGKSTYQFFTEELYNEIVERTLLEMDLRKALQKNELFLHYQPQFHFETGKVSGAEALLRWKHPVRGMISPAQFIPIAEETGLILSIGQWVLETACRQAREWQLLGLNAGVMSVNVSQRQFNSPTFIADVKKTLQLSGLSPQYLNIEITESMTSDVDYCQSILHELRNIGTQVSIDDFGTGYSSLSYLSRFPLTHLKIDQTFVRNLETDTVIVKAIIDLAKNLHLRVVAEGVETEEQALFLKQSGCDEAQGYLYSRPLPVEDIQKLLENTVCG